MSFETLIKRLQLPGEYFYLEELVTPSNAVKNEIGDLTQEWQEVGEIIGTVQWVAQLVNEPKGRLETTEYNGFFVADFDIPDKKMGEFRIKHITAPPNNVTQYFKIHRIDRHLVWRRKRHHYEMVLELDPKWY
jgi:hypothetical protein